jgi:3-phosphoshikimate 1-carboxyvinyltransferase
MTLNWLSSQGIELKTDDDLANIAIKGGQSYRPFKRRVPGDFSSATFLLCAGVLAGGTITLHGLEMDDPQGDKAVIGILGEMGASIEVTGNSVTVHGGSLKGIDVDMNAIPDALPMLAASACFAVGTTILHNVGQARIKETDRISVMAQELKKLGGDVKELPDGLEIRGTGLKGGCVHGHGDHRVVMACAVAGCAAEGTVTIDTAEAADVTFPGFWDTMMSLGADINFQK